MVLLPIERVAKRIGIDIRILERAGEKGRERHLHNRPSSPFQDSVELLHGPPVIRHVLPHMVADDSVEVLVRIVDGGYVDPLNRGVHQRYVALERILSASGG